MTLPPKLVWDSDCWFKIIDSTYSKCKAMHTSLTTLPMGLFRANKNKLETNMALTWCLKILISRMQTIWLYTVHVRSAAKGLKWRQTRTSPFSCEGLEPGTTWAWLFQWWCTFQRICHYPVDNCNKTYCAIHQIEIYLVDSAIHPSNNWSQITSPPPLPTLLHCLHFHTPWNTFFLNKFATWSEIQ